MAQKNHPQPKLPGGTLGDTLDTSIIKFETHCPPHFLFTARQELAALLLSGLQCFLMNSDEFRLIFGSDTESEDYIFTGFSGKDLIMADTNASSKKHSWSKRSPTTPSVQENDVEETLQVEPCVRPCLNWPKSKQKSSEEDGPNGPCPGMSSDNQDACHVAHVGQDAGVLKRTSLVNPNIWRG